MVSSLVSSGIVSEIAIQAGGYHAFMDGGQGILGAARSQPAGWYDVGGGWARYWTGEQWGETLDQETLHRRMAARQAGIAASAAMRGVEQPGRSVHGAWLTSERQAASSALVPGWVAPVMIAMGSALVVLGSLLPWATILSIFGSLSVAGTQGTDGKVTLGLGVAGCVFAALFFAWRAPSAVAALLTSLAATGVGVVDLVRTSRALGEETEGVVAQVGIGLWLVVLGGILAVVSAGMTLVQRLRWRAKMRARWT